MQPPTPGAAYPQGPVLGDPYGAQPYPPWGQGYRPGNRPAPVNGLAIASLALGVLCCLPAVGLVLGLVALRQIGKRGERGKGLAVAGAVLSSAGLALWAVALSTGFLAEVWHGVRAGATDSVTLSEGTCFDSPAGLEGEAYDFDEVPCAGRHDGEVFAVVTLPGGAYPGDRELTDVADDKCYALRTEYAMDAWALPDHVDVYYLLPSRRSWRLGDHAITCVFGNTDADAGLTGSLRNDERTLDAHQLAYVRAADVYNTALEAAPDVVPEDDLTANKEWAAQVAAALDEEAHMLGEHRWPADAKKPLAAVVEELEALETEWALAAVATGTDGFYEHYDRALESEDPDTTVTAREALGLAATPPSYGDGHGDPETGGGETEAEV